MLYMHNVTLTENGQKKKIGQLLEVVLTPPMEGGVRTTSRSCQWRIQVCYFYQFLCQTGRNDGRGRMRRLILRRQQKITFLAQKQWLPWCEHHGLWWCGHHGSHLCWTLPHETKAAAMVSSICFFSASLFYVLIWFIFLFTFSDKRRAPSE
jgi:hypothetical protein